MLKRILYLGALALSLGTLGPVWADATLVGEDAPTEAAGTAANLVDRISDVFGTDQKVALGGGAQRLTPVDTSAPVTRDLAPARIVYDWSWIDEQPGDAGDRQWKCLAEALYHEARGESVKGQFAVAEVVLNRVESRLWPSSICNVVHQGTGRHLQCQFTWTCDGHSDRISERRAWLRAGKIAQIMMSGGARVLTGGATHYHTRAVNPRWSRKFPRTATIGTHFFYRHPRS